MWEGTLDEAKKYIESTRDLKHYEIDMKKLTDAFRIFWESLPSEDEFNKIMTGILFGARMLYIMVSKKRA